MPARTNHDPGERLLTAKSSRREFISKTLVLGVSATGIGGVLAACGGSTNNTPAANNTSGGTSTPGQSTAQNPSAKQSPEQLQFNPPPTAAPTQSRGAPQGGATSSAQPTSGTSQGTTPATASTPATPTQFKEAPALKDMVSSGKLPKLEERLPQKPMVLQPIEQVGKYGGQWNLALPSYAGGGVGGRLNDAIGYEQLLRWKPGGKNLTTDQVIPGIAESFQVAKDGAEYTFKLRKGMKWSDGKPFTADDILFWYDDVVKNKDLSPGGAPGWLIPNEKTKLDIKKTDDYTVVFSFNRPNGLFLVNMATQRGGAVTSMPSHFMKQFHKKYNKNVEQLAKKEKQKDWISLFNSKRSDWDNPDKPVLYAWKLKSAVGANTQRVEAERNPYYYKVDTEGNQLPYMDKAVFTLVQNAQVWALKVANGEVDMTDFTVNTLQNKPVFFRSKEKGNYHFFDLQSQDANQMTIEVNMTHPDKNKRKVFSDKNFRIGLSYAINRPEIIQVVFQGQGEPAQCGPLKGTPFYHEKLTKQYTEYNVDKANQYLDKVLPKKGTDGIRLGLDGKPFSFQVEISGNWPVYPQVMELVKSQWRKVGIDISTKVEQDELFILRMTSNQQDACTYHPGGGLGSLMDAMFYFPFNFNSGYAEPWMKWYQNPKQDGAMKPPKIVRHQMDLYGQIIGTADFDQQVKLMGQILDIAADQFYCMGITLKAGGYGIFTNRMHNTPKESLNDWLHCWTAPNNTSQYYVEG